MKTTNNLHNYVDLLKTNSVEHIAEIDWTQTELLDFAEFIRHMAKWYNIPAVEKLYRNSLVPANCNYNMLMSSSTIEEIEDPNAEYLDEAFVSCKICVEHMAQTLVKCAFFNELYR